MLDILLRTTPGAKSLLVIITKDKRIEAHIVRPPPSVESCRPLPDSLAIFVNFTDPVEGNPPRLTGFIEKFECTAFIRRKCNLLKSDALDRAFRSIKIADLKPAVAKCPVVTDAVQQFVNRCQSSSSSSRTADW